MSVTAKIYNKERESLFINIQHSFNSYSMLGAFLSALLSLNPFNLTIPWGIIITVLLSPFTDEKNEAQREAKWLAPGHM